MQHAMNSARFVYSECVCDLCALRADVDCCMQTRRFYVVTDGQDQVPIAVAVLFVVLSVQVVVEMSVCVAVRRSIECLQGHSAGTRPAWAVVLLDRQTYV